MPAPLNPNLWPVVLHDEDGVPQGTASNPLIVSGGAGPGVAAIITGLTQVQNVETVTPLGASATFNGAARDCINYESFGISVYVEADPAAPLDTDVVVENSSDGGATWRTVDTISLKNSVNGSNKTLNRVYSVTRQDYRVSVTNNDGTALVATEVVSMLKPV